MAYWMDRSVGYATQMGGEGIPWIGQAPFVETDHIFQQLGDGTYYHSGLIAIRSAVAAGINITYKILFNDAVAMTGGQPVDGQLTVPQITHQVHNEGVKRIAILTDETEKYGNRADFAPGVTISDRADIDYVQRELRQIKGTTILIYDQTCAAEKRRRRKRGTFPDPAKRMFINDRVCEGCGDCGKKSNCVSVLPVDTAFGRKRRVDQSSCNKDYSCNQGFCPSFVTVYGGDLREGQNISDVPDSLSSLPEPDLKKLEPGKNYGILIGGVGGTGVVTIGALLGMASHIDELGVSIVDQLGFAQKGGAVMTHIRIAASGDDINSARLNAGGADLLLGCDMMVVSSEDALGALAPGRTQAVLNTHKSITGDFVLNPKLEYPLDSIETRLLDGLGNSNATFLDASDLATKLLGDSIGSNLFLVGFAWQQGLIPISKKAINKAIELNGVKVDWNKEAFEWGRRAANNLAAVVEIANSNQVERETLPESLDDLFGFYADELTLYQNETYANRFLRALQRIRGKEASVVSTSEQLTKTVAANLFKLMAYKDEYEVARLYSDPSFKRKLEEQFDGNYRLKFNLSPPVIAPRDKVTGLPRKISLGGWALPMFKLLAKLKFLRGTIIDPFGLTAERRKERQLIEDYFTHLDDIVEQLSTENLTAAIELADYPDEIGGYGYIKHASIEEAEARKRVLLDNFHNRIFVKAA